MTAALALFTFAIRDSGQWGTVAFAAILALAAFSLGRLTKRLSGPRDLWAWMLAGSLPVFALLSLALSSGGAAYAAGMLLALLLPPPVLAYSSRPPKGVAVDVD